MAEWRERLIGRCFPVVTFICLITEEKLVQVKEFPLTRIHSFQKEQDEWRLTGEVQPVGVLCCVEFHNTSLVPAVALLNLSACHGARGAGINLMTIGHTKTFVFETDFCRNETTKYFSTQFRLTESYI